MLKDLYLFLAKNDWEYYNGKQELQKISLALSVDFRIICFNKIY